MYNTSMDTITVNDVEYDVDRSDRDGRTTFTIMLDGEDVFEGLEGSIGYDEFAQEHHNPREWSNVGRMRPSIRRYYEGSVGVYELADGREAHVTWLHNGQTTVDVVVWIPGESQPSHQTERRMMDNVYRIHAARVSERFLVELES